jgi:hypothetical protein
MFLYPMASRLALGGHSATYSKDTGSLTQKQSGRSVKLTTYLPLVPRSRMIELYLDSPISLHDIALR